MKHKRYLVFCFYDYYPGGGIGDVKDSFDDLPEAIAYCKDQSYDYRYVYDRIKGEEVYDADTI